VRPGTERIAAITTSHSRPRDADLLVNLANLVHRNRLAVILLVANLGAAGTRARDVAAATAAARWLSRNANAVRLFLRSLSILLRCAPQAGYRVIQDVRRPFRRRRAPRLLRHRLGRRASAGAVRAVVTMRRMPPSVASVG
jgi:hypothetical protein